MAQKLWNLTLTEGAEAGEERVDRDVGDVGVPPLPHARVAGGSDGGNGSLQRPPSWPHDEFVPGLVRGDAPRDLRGHRRRHAVADLIVARQPPRVLKKEDATSVNHDRPHQGIG